MTSGHYQYICGGAPRIEPGWRLMDLATGDRFVVTSNEGGETTMRNDATGEVCAIGPMDTVGLLWPIQHGRNA